MNYKQFEIINPLSIDAESSYGYWQVSYVSDPLADQLLDCHSFLLDAELREVCIYTDTELHQYCIGLIEYLNDNDLSGSDLYYHHYDNVKHEDYNEDVILEWLDYKLYDYMEGIFVQLSFGPNPGGGCLGYWDCEEDDF